MLTKFFLVTVILSATFLGSNGQCMYVDTGYGRQGLGSCQSFGSSSAKLTCNAAGTALMQSYYSNNACTGTPFSSSDVTSQYRSFSCTGQVCSITRETYDNAMCSGTPASSSQNYVDGSCSRGRAEYCDAMNFYTYSFGSTDAGCTNNQSSPYASISTTAMNKCIPFTDYTAVQTNPGNFTHPQFNYISRRRYRKYTSCNTVGTKPVLTFGASYTHDVYTGTQGCVAANLETKFQYRIESKCDTSPCPSCAGGVSSSQQFCYGNGGALWYYNWESSGCSTNLQSAIYFNTGCGNVGALALFSGLSNTSSYSLTCSGPSPPTLRFPSNQFGQLEGFLDASCTQFAYGGYALADGSCSDSTSSGTSTSASCTPNGGVVVNEYNGFGCNGTLNTTTTLTSACTKVPGSDINGNPVYFKATKCGIGGGTTVNPGDAPNVKTLSGVGRYRGFGILVLVLLVFVFSL